MAEDRVYDTIIIGGGPAGLTAGIYAARARLSALLLEKGLPGGQMATTDVVENYPGFPEGITGADLAMKMDEQARKWGLETQLMSDVEGLEVEGDVKTVKTAEGQFKARTLIIATGANPRKLGVPGEEEFRGRGVSYCATCDGAFFRDQALVVVGGGDSAIEEALFLTRYARSVTIVHRRGELRAAKAIQEKAGAEPKIRFVLDTVVEEISGADKVERVRTRNLKTGQTGEIPCGGVFIYVGMLPATEFLPPGVRLSDQKYIVTDESLETSAPGVFAAGDCRAKEVRQVVTAVGEGAQAAISAERYITVGARRRA